MLSRFRNLNLGDSIRIRSCFLPPVQPGRVRVHSKFVSYVRDVENLFTVIRILDYGGDPLIAVFETSPLLEYRQIERILTGGFLVVNSHG